MKADKSGIRKSIKADNDQTDQNKKQMCKNISYELSIAIWTINYYCENARRTQ